MSICIVKAINWFFFSVVVWPLMDTFYSINSINCKLNGTTRKMNWKCEITHRKCQMQWHFWKSNTTPHSTAHLTLPMIFHTAHIRIQCMWWFFFRFDFINWALAQHLIEKEKKEISMVSVYEKGKLSLRKLAMKVNINAINCLSL